MAAPHEWVSLLVLKHWNNIHNNDKSETIFDGNLCVKVCTCSDVSWIWGKLHNREVMKEIKPGVTLMPVCHEVHACPELLYTYQYPNDKCSDWY